jgi:type II secretory pathway pseudopilin PulG
MKQRTGATLIEVLVAIFVMGIGLIALLALFPIGALSMAQAIRDDRCAHAAQNATALANSSNLRRSFDAMFKNPYSAVPGADQLTTDAVPEGASYPIYVDPVGDASYSEPYRTVVGGDPLKTYRSSPTNPVTYMGPVPRAAFTFTGINTLRAFTVLDDIEFETNGIPRGITYSGTGTPSGTVQRQGAYSWAYLLRRPQHGSPDFVELTIVVYHQRSLSLNTQLAGAETTFRDCQLDAGRPNVVRFNWNPANGERAPAVRPGGWIFDITPVVLTRDNTGAITRIGPGHAYFYRVLNVTELPGNAVECEVDQPIRRLVNRDTQASRFVVMENVAEVFEKGTGWHP